MVEDVPKGRVLRFSCVWRDFVVTPQLDSCRYAVIRDVPSLAKAPKPRQVGVMKLATVVRTFSPVEAQLMRSRLDAAGILAVVTHEAAALSMEGYSMSTGGVLVQTAEEDVAEARALLELDPPTDPA